MKQLLELVQEKYAEQLSAIDIHELEEIRMRIGQPVELCCTDCVKYLWPVCSKNDMERLLMSACRQSVYAHTETLRRGFITIDGGHRIGICGMGVIRNDEIHTIKDISSVNIRISHQIKGCARKLLSEVSTSTLIIGPPASGKTTLMRDLIRLLSDERGQRVGVADERAELSAAGRDGARLDLGKRSDVIVNIPKAEAAMMLLRTMNPQWIAMDEITSPDDVQAVVQIAYSGVLLLATGHAFGYEDLTRRKLYRQLIRDGIFTTIVTLKADKTYSIRRIEI